MTDHSTPASPSPAPLPAGLLVRLAAMIYDGLLLIACFAIVSAILVPLGTPAGAAKSHTVDVLPAWYRHFVLTPGLLTTVYLFYGYFWRKSGQTLGMQTWRLKLTRADGTLAGWGEGLKRVLATLLLPVVCGLLTSLWGSDGAFVLATVLGFFGNYLWMFCNPGRLTLQDRLSGTLVWRLPVEPRKKGSRLGIFALKD